MHAWTTLNSSIILTREQIFVLTYKVESEAGSKFREVSTRVPNIAQRHVHLYHICGYLKKNTNPLKKSTEPSPRYYQTRPRFTIIFKFQQKLAVFTVYVKIVTKKCIFPLPSNENLQPCQRLTRPREKSVPSRPWLFPRGDDPRAPSVNFPKTLRTRPRRFARCAFSTACAVNAFGAGGKEMKYTYIHRSCAPGARYAREVQTVVGRHRAAVRSADVTAM